MRGLVAGGGLAALRRRHAPPHLDRLGWDPAVRGRLVLQRWFFPSSLSATWDGLWALDNVQRAAWAAVDALDRQVDEHWAAHNSCRGAADRLRVGRGLGAVTRASGVVSCEGAGAGPCSVPTLDFHVDKGLFIAFVPALMVSEVGGPSAASCASVLRTGGGREVEAALRPDCGVCLFGDGVNQCMSPTHRQPPLRVPEHAFYMSRETPGWHRVWYGMVQLPPCNAMNDEVGMTFGDIRDEIFLASAQGDEHGAQAAFWSWRKAPHRGGGPGGLRSQGPEARLRRCALELVPGSPRGPHLQTTVRGSRHHHSCVDEPR